MRKLGMALVATFALFACSKAPKFVGVMKTPVFPGAKQVGHEKSHSRQGDSMDSLSKYTMNTWKFEAKASEKEILAFYADRVPEAKPGEKVWEDDLGQYLSW